MPLNWFAVASCAQGIIIVLCGQTLYHAGHLSLAVWHPRPATQVTTVLAATII